MTLIKLIQGTTLDCDRNPLFLSWFKSLPPKEDATCTRAHSSSKEFCAFLKSIQATAPLQAVLMGCILPSPTCLILGKKTHSVGPLCMLRCAPWELVTWLIAYITTVCQVWPWDGVSMGGKTDDALTGQSRMGRGICYHGVSNSYMCILLVQQLHLLLKHFSLLCPKKDWTLFDFCK